MKSPYVAGAIVGAAIGGALGYLLFSDEGRRKLDAVGVVFDQALKEMNRLNSTWQRVREGMDEYLQAVDAAVDEGMPPVNLDGGAATPSGGRVM